MSDSTAEPMHVSLLLLGHGETETETQTETVFARALVQTDVAIAADRLGVQALDHSAPTSMPFTPHKCQSPMAARLVHGHSLI